MKTFNFIFKLLTALFLNYVSVIGSPVDTLATNLSIQRHLVNTCADPTLTDVYVEAFLPELTLHIIRPRWLIVDNTSGGRSMEIQSLAFCAWQTPQDNTVPLFQMFNPTTNDAIFLISTDGDPPTASGFEVELIVGYVYSTQVCGSIPLLAAAQVTNSDHWYTTNVREHSSLLANKWTDAGVPAFVLPLSSTLSTLTDRHTYTC